MNATQPTVAEPAGSEPYPCPFCGGLAKVSELANVWRAGCPQCDVETVGFFDREDAVETWNRRSEWDHKAVGAAMRKERARCELSIRAMARRMGCSAPYVSDLEKGRRIWTPNTIDWYRGALPPNAQPSSGKEITT